jgi:arylsulfatase A-like enzyme
MQTSTPPIRKHPNIVLILADSMRAANVSCYGYHRPTTPHIDQLATQGILFQNAFVPAPFTVASIASLLTGVYPSTHGLEHYRQRLSDSLLSFPEYLREQGYFTAAFVVNPHVNEESGLTRGFKYSTDARAWYKRPRLASPFVAWAESGAAINRRVHRQLTKAKQEPFFFLIFYNDSHVPFSNLPRLLLPLIGKKFHTPDFDSHTYTDAELERIKRLYDRALQRTDAHIGQAWQFFQQAQLIKDTYFLISADHGEGLDRRPDRGGHGRLFENGIHVPLLVLPPGQCQAGRIVEDLVSLLDIAPTLLELSGLDAPLQFDGRSLVPYLNREGPKPRDYIVSEYHDRCCIRTARWKLILRTTGISKTIVESTADVELYDLTNDPDESLNEAHEYPELVADLRSKLREILKSAADKGRPAGIFAEDSVILKRLQGLGYLD